jgi:hypothetical protein
MEIAVRKLCDEIAQQRDGNNSPGSCIVSLTFKEKPGYEHYELVRAVQKYLPEVGIETIHDFVPGKDCYRLEWKVHY